MIIRSLCVATILWLCTAAAVSADDATPPPADTPVPVATEAAPTAPPVSTVVPATEPPVAEPTDVTVAPERSTPVTSISNPGVAVPTPRPETQPPITGPAHVQPPPSASAGTVPPDIAVPPTESASSGPPPGVSLPDTSPGAATGLDLSPEPAAAQAPTQLTCSAKKHPVASPFLSSPYAGWTELVSFVDHDQPDYTVDGTIVLANGLSALASDGQESDLFPAYWSPGLRQYVNYDGHNGYDFDISYQPVLAAAAGTVEYAGWNDPNPYVGYGQMVLINHHNGYVTLYGHLSKLEVSTGDKVSAGQEIGISGTTGHSSGPHLHFSVFHDCQVADPYGWTGKGTDPLQLFSGSRSAYLWLPGQDPLLLNPPPNWPSYPDGLHLAFGGSPKRVGARNVPPADRLLLLSLPSPHGLPPLDSGTALARTEAQVTAEAQSLAPRLDELKARGQLTAYQYIPSAAAVWVRGSASAQRLEDLQGVASLSGVQPHDILAAQAGLAHAVLAQIGRQQAPSLWPVGFRSDLHAWRPVATVLLGEGFVDGLALPGKPVAISLRRGSEIPAAALAAADPTSGGFVGLLHDGAGNIMSVRAGDVVRVTCEGRTTEIAVTPAGLSARRDGISGQTLPGATLALSVLPVGDPRTVHVLTSNEAGRFDAPTGPTLAAGTQIVAGLTDASGNEQAMAAFVPGIAVVEHSSLVHGWAVGKSPRLVLRRASHTLVDTALHPAADGAYSLSLRRAGKPLRLKAGDVLEVGSRLHHRTIRLPKVALAVSGGRMLSIRGPAGLVVTVSVDPPGAPPWTQSATLPPTGSKSLVLPTAASRSGGRASAEMTTPQGDVIAVERTLPAESQR